MKLTIFSPDAGKREITIDDVIGMDILNGIRANVQGQMELYVPQESDIVSFGVFRFGTDLNNLIFLKTMKCGIDYKDAFFEDLTVTSGTVISNYKPNQTESACDIVKIDEHYELISNGNTFSSGSANKFILITPHDMLLYNIDTTDEQLMRGINHIKLDKLTVTNPDTFNITANGISSSIILNNNYLIILPDNKFLMRQKLDTMFMVLCSKISNKITEVNKSDMDEFINDAQNQLLLDN